MSNLLVTMSGGTTSVINATLAGIISEAQKSTSINKIYAGVPGIIGLLNGNILDLTNLSRSKLDILKHSPGSASIGTTRAKIFDKIELDSIKECFEKYNIKYFVNIGGNGTIKQSKSIADHITDIKIAAAPKTVDNDLGDQEFEQLWFTPGFPSCVNYWYHKIKMLNNENNGAYDHDRIIATQTFGRETGFIVGSLRLSDRFRELPLVLLLPEDQQTTDTLLGHVEDKLAKFGRVVVAMAEGYKIKDYDQNHDLSGQIMYGSSASTAVQEFVNLCNLNNLQARGYNPTIDQRQNFEYTVKNDIEVSYDVGCEVIKNFMKDRSHFFQSYSKDCFNTVPLSEITDYSRTMKSEWIDFGNFDVTDKYVDYLQEIVTPTPSKELFVLGEVL